MSWELSGIFSDFKMSVNRQRMVVCLVSLPWEPVARGAELLFVLGGQ